MHAPRFFPKPTPQGSRAALKTSAATMWRCCQSNRNSSPIGGVVALGARPQAMALQLGQCGRAAFLVGLSIDEVAFLVEVVVDVGMDRGELLQGLHSPEPEHRALASSERQVAVLDPVVGPAADLLLLGVAQLVHCRTVGSQTVGGDLLGRTVALKRLLHEGQSGFLVAGPGDVTLEDLAFLIDRAPQVDHLAIQLHVHLVKVPAPLAETLHPAHPLPADVAGEQWTEPAPPHRTVSWQRSIPRSNNRSSTLRKDNGNRTYIIITGRMTSGEELK